MAASWKQIRSLFIRLRGLRNHSEIADAANILPNVISKLEANDNLGPTVATFLKAIEGLGISPAEFFAQLEPPQQMETGRQTETDNNQLKSTVRSVTSVASQEGGAIARSNTPTISEAQMAALRNAVIRDIADTLFTATSHAPAKGATADARRPRSRPKTRGTRG